MRERGLKFGIFAYFSDQGSVAPHAGAWIEIPETCNDAMLQYLSLPMRERGLK